MGEGAARAFGAALAARRRLVGDGRGMGLEVRLGTWWNNIEGELQALMRQVADEAIAAAASAAAAGATDVLGGGAAPPASGSGGSSAA